MTRHDDGQNIGMTLFEKRMDVGGDRLFALMR
jgi:hypothetical protein